MSTRAARLMRWRAGLVAVGMLAVAACADDSNEDTSAPAADDAGDADVAGWLHLGFDLANTRAATDESIVGPDNVGSLEPAWELADVNGVTGTPIVADGVLYVGDWSGHVRALDAVGGDERWSTDLGADYIGGALAVDGSRVFAGTSDARLVALDRESGERVWEERVDDHPMASIDGSPVQTDGLVIVGVSSFENFVEDVDEYTFRGSVVALDAESGEELWRYRATTGDEGAGVGIWSSPAVDTERGHVYIGTGQHYVGPASERSDAVVALDVTTGELQWAHQYTEGDIWSVNHPDGPHVDVGAPPNLFQVDGTGAVGAGDKAGVYKALDRETGDELWSQDLTDGSLLGGVMASAAVVDGTIFVASNRGGAEADLIALDADAGDERWRVDVGANVVGPVTWANDVVYVADNTGRISGFDARDGRLVWSHEVDAQASGGVAVVDGTVYAGWGWWFPGTEPDDPEGGLIAFRPGGATPDDGT
ncbi:MAG TPA: PQQ-binding-like beta-propeller repeat protein [Acidimicrobiales bacterium]